MDMKCTKCLNPWNWWYIRDDVLKDEPLFQKMKKVGGYVRDYPTTGQETTETAAHDDTAKWQFRPGPVVAQCPNCIHKDVKLTEAQELQSMAQSALADILGDDIDGLMAEMEDFFG